MTTGSEGPDGPDGPGGAVLSFLRDLGDVEQLQALAKAGPAPRRRPMANSHVHLPPNFSAFATVAQAVDLAAEQGLAVLGAGNYYHYGVYAEFAARCRRRGVFPLFGLEVIAMQEDLRQAGVKVNDPGNPGKTYLCGKGIVRFDPMSGAARRLIGTIRRSDRRRMAEMIGKMTSAFAAAGLACELDEAAIVGQVARRHGCPRRTVYLQERHVAQAFQEEFFRLVPVGQRGGKLAELLGLQSEAARAANAASPPEPVKVQNDLRSHLMKAGKAAFVPESFLSFPQACRLVLELGGLPCYPTLADGAQPICPYEQPVAALIERLKAAGIHCAELIPIRNQPGVLEQYALAMRKAALVVTAGTEHNTLDLLAMAPACVGGLPIGQELLDIFWEGACVLAAHQFLAARGRCGFVDGQGRPNAAFADAESRIRAFARLGQAVISRYQDMTGQDRSAKFE